MTVTDYFIHVHILLYMIVRNFKLSYCKYANQWQKKWNKMRYMNRIANENRNLLSMWWIEVRWVHKNHCSCDWLYEWSLLKNFHLTSISKVLVPDLFIFFLFQSHVTASILRWRMEPDFHHMYMTTVTWTPVNGNEAEKEIEKLQTNCNRSKTIENK